MEKITSYEQLEVAFGHSKMGAAAYTIAHQNGSDVTQFPPEVWELREFLRGNTGTYTWCNIPGDEWSRFAHFSLAGDGRIAYTKNAEKGAADLQTCTTMEAYCEKFGLTAPEVPILEVATTRVSLDEHLALRRSFDDLFDLHAELSRKYDALVAAAGNYVELKAAATQALKVLENTLLK